MDSGAVAVQMCYRLTALLQVVARDANMGLLAAMFAMSSSIVGGGVEESGLGAGGAGAPFARVLRSQE